MHGKSIVLGLDLLDEREISLCMHGRISGMRLTPWKRNVFIFPLNIYLVSFGKKYMFYMQE